MPVMNPQAVTRVLPSSSTYKAIYANQDYAYQFSVGETDGIDGSADYATGQVNSAVNYGTTIRVPVPRYFTLDESATRRKRHCRPQRLQRRDDDHAARRRFIRHRHHCAQKAPVASIGRTRSRSISWANSRPPRHSRVRNLWRMDQRS